MTKDDFISIWGTMSDIARDIGEGETTVRGWFARGSIPARHDRKLMEAAGKRGHVVTPMTMFQLRENLKFPRGQVLKYGAETDGGVK